MHNVTIIPVLNGWQVQVGCQTVVFDNPDKMLTELRSYLVDPEATVKRYQQEGCNARFIKGGLPEPVPMAPMVTEGAPQETAGRNPVSRIR